VTSRLPPDDRPLGDLLGMRELFREEARAILDRLRRRLSGLEGESSDARALADVVADGVALKGSGALVGLAVVSRAGILVVRAAVLAAARTRDDLPGALGVVSSLRASLGTLERLVDVCLEGDEAMQDAVLAEALDRFAPADRSILRSGVDGADDRVVATAVAGIVDALTDLLLADTQLGAVERELDVLATAADRRDGNEASIVRRIVEALAARAAPARALARSAAELHRWVRTLDARTTALETLVLVHVGEACYGLPADDVERVLPGATAIGADDAGRATFAVDGESLPGLDLGRYLRLGSSAPSSTLAVVRVGNRRFALLVTRAEPPRLMVLRPLDAPLSSHPLARAATIGARGEVVLVLSASALREALEGRTDLPSVSA
jgi:chemotaxis protein histidine kinase CheA